MSVVAQPAAPLSRLAETAQRIRRHALQMVAAAGSGHLGGAFSAAELLAGLYVGQALRHDPARPDWSERDRFVLSKGHPSAALYATLAEAGYVPCEELATFRRFGSRLQGQPSPTNRPPGLEVQGGSLGHGLAIGLGLALGLRRRGSAARVWVLLGDGECQEGEVWESAMAAAHYRVAHLTAIVDYNKVQQDGTVAEIMDLRSLAAKWRAFGWAVREIAGHVLPQVRDAYTWARGLEGEPTAILAHTTRGRGVSFMEGRPEELLAVYGLTPADVAQAARRAIARRTQHERG